VLCVHYLRSSLLQSVIEYVENLVSRCLQCRYLSRMAILVHLFAQIPHGCCRLAVMQPSFFMAFVLLQVVEQFVVFALDVHRYVPYVVVRGILFHVCPSSF
jgi:hypothetical protein